MSMRVKYIGKRKRINSFGTFEPGKEYDVEKDIAFSLLSVPILFQLMESEEVEEQVEIKEPEKFDEKPYVIKKKVNKRKKRKK